MNYVALDQTDLTKAQLLSALEQRFQGRYEVQNSWLPAVHVMVRKSPWSGVALKLQPKAGALRLRCVPAVPSSLARLVTGNGLLGWLFLRTTTKRMLEEIKEFAETPGAFNGDSRGDTVASAPAKVAGERATAPAASKWPGRVLTALTMGWIALVSLPAIAWMLGFSIPFLGQYNIKNTAAIAGAALLVSPAIRFEPVLALVAWMLARLFTAAFLETYGSVVWEVQSWMSAFGFAQMAAMVIGGFGLRWYRLRRHAS